jgi:hypothetical protein
MYAGAACYPLKPCRGVLSPGGPASVSNSLSEDGLARKLISCNRRLRNWQLDLMDPMTDWSGAVQRKPGCVALPTERALSHPAVML